MHFVLQLSNQHPLETIEFQLSILGLKFVIWQKYQTPTYMYMYDVLMQKCVHDVLTGTEVCVLCGNCEVGFMTLTLVL